MTGPELVVIGCGGQGREIAWIAEQLDRPVLGFLDDHPSADALERCRELQLPVLGGIDDPDVVPPAAEYVIGVAAPASRRLIADRMETGHTTSRVASPLIHPDATVGRGTVIGRGSVLWPGARLTTGISVGRHVYINQNVTIGHDTVVHDACTINPSAAVSGSCVLEFGALIGSNATVLQGLRVGRKSVVGAAACVVRDVDAAVTVKGLPAR